MKKRLLQMVTVILVIIFAIAGCPLAFEENPPQEIAGIYKSERFSLLEIPFAVISGKRIAVGTTLSLDKDQTFQYVTCGSVMKGNYEVTNDSLLLHVKDAKYRIDSLNSVGFNGQFLSPPKKPIIFEIEQDRLYQDLSPQTKNPISRLQKLEAP